MKINSTFISNWLLVLCLAGLMIVGLIMMFNNNENGIILFFAGLFNLVFYSLLPNFPNR